MKLSLREYQKRALDFILEKKKGIVVLPTGTGKTFVGLALIRKVLLNKPSVRALIIVPTRILVEQTKEVYEKYGLKAAKIYGIYHQKERKDKWRESNIIISTPETVYYDLDFIGEFDIIIADECHHAIGNDVYRKVLREISAEYILGLSAYIAPKRRKELSKLIGEIYEISAKDPELRGYIPKWIGDIFESRFNPVEWDIYSNIENRRDRALSRDKMLYTLALRYFSVDGALALKDSLLRGNKLRTLLSDLREDIFNLRDLHKLSSLFQILDIYNDFKKAIIFVDRVIVARRLVDILNKRYRATIIIGRRNRSEIDYDLLRESRIIVATSAGEEGVDLPSADLLVIWSNTSSPLRFIQRHGRIMRPTKPLKFATFIVTPNTIDMDFFITGLEFSKKYIDIGVPSTLLNKYFRKSRIYSILSLLNVPMDLNLLKKISRKTYREVNTAIKLGLQRGYIVYFYSPFGKLFILKEHALTVLEKYNQFFNPVFNGKVKFTVNGRRLTVSGDYFSLYKKLKNKLPIEHPIIVRYRNEGDLISYDYLSYKYTIDDLILLSLVLRNALSNF